MIGDSGRKSNRHAKQAQKVSSILQAYTSKDYITRFSLLNNLFSSEQLSLSFSDQEFMKIYFGKDNVEENQLYQFTYFHKRDKKVLLYFFILYFLTNSEKIQLAVFENGERINTQQFREFLVNPKFGGSQAILKQMETRIIFFRAETHQMYKLNLHFLSFHLQQRQFLKAIIVSDINEYESGDKSSLERIYKKIPKNLFILSFKKQIYDYKFIQKANFPFVLSTDESTDHYELHEKVTKNINKTIENFKSHHLYVVPIEHIGISSKNHEESFRSVVVRKDEDNELNEYIFTAWPFQLKAFHFAESQSSTLCFNFGYNQVNKKENMEQIEIFTIQRLDGDTSNTLNEL